jgi:hypothetical protein
VAQAPPVWPARTGFDVDVVVHNASEQLLCSAIDITLTWRSGARTAHSETVSSANTGGSSTAALHVASRTVESGALHYVVTATQRCGWLDGSTTFVGRSPAKGWSTVTVLS